MADIRPGPVTAADIGTMEPIIRRVILAAHVRNPADVDDLVHDALERLLRAQPRLSPEALVPFSVVTARNLVISRARRQQRRERKAYRLVSLEEPDSPVEAVLGGEVRQAMLAGLAQLSPDERDALLAYQERADDTEVASGATRVRMARIRAKLRVEFLLAYRHVDLPTPVCRAVLVSISSGDTRRQRVLQSGDHLLSCSTCAQLSEPLSRRSLGLTALMPLSLVRWVVRTTKAHPVGSAGAGAVAAGGIAVGALFAAQSVPHRASPLGREVVKTTSTTLASPVLAGVTVDHGPLHPAAIGSLAGDSATASGVKVQAVVTHDGFWVGSSTTDRVWVELVGPLRPLHVKEGEVVRFRGTVVADQRTYAAAAGVSSADGAALLDDEGAHIQVQTTDLTAVPR